ncbi:sporulation protein YqfC [Paenibacillus pini]|uniref:Sporulation protein YqfC n=1 Tax=Paenibacillus pini JCM 16418 TaxID=1236976 RepID=W7YHH0_9BACL|nr:sporulation protein YqfC [Paenibacillus pini]GAF07033.1 hypothetical protein JCM16418_1020 [Paenibacillus pini JCM 16418]
MTRMSHRLRKWTNEMLDLPQDVVLDLPRITMVGNQEIYIENHRGLQHFASDRIVLSLSKGSLEILGAEMVIRAIMPEEVLVEGKVFHITYHEMEESL